MIEKVDKVLIGDPDPRARSWSAIAFGQIGDRVTVGTLRQALADGDQATQVWAIRSLGQLRDRASVDLLIARLGDADSSNRVRRAAAIALAKIGDSRAVEPVRGAHDEAAGFTRRRIGRALDELEAQRAGLFTTMRN